MFWFRIGALILGLLLIVGGFLLKWWSKPDPQLAAIHREDAKHLRAKGKTEDAALADLYAIEAELGIHLVSPEFLNLIICVGVVIAGIALALIFL